MGRIGDDERRPTLGTALRAARGRESLRELSHRTHISRTALNRFELDQRVPSRQVLAELDAALDQHGALLAYLRFDDWAPIGPGATVHHWTVPAAWVGPVWFHLAAPLGATSALLRWGPWARTVEVDERTGEGATFTMAVNRHVDAGEEADDRVISCHTSTPTHLFWASGSPPNHLDATDVTDGWVPYEQGPLLAAAGRLISDALAHCGRTPSELAEWLGVDLAVVDNLLRGEPMV